MIQTLTFQELGIATSRSLVFSLCDDVWVRNCRKPIDGRSMLTGHDPSRREQRDALLMRMNAQPSLYRVVSSLGAPSRTGSFTARSRLVWAVWA